MLIELNSYVTCGVAVIVILFGSVFNNKINFLQKFCIPIPVVGGLAFSLFLSIGHILQIYEIKVDTYYSDLFMLVFYAGIGYNAKIKTLIEGGKQILAFLILSIVLVCFQNLIGIKIAELFHIEKIIGLACSSVALTGGHGTSAAFSKTFENAGLSDAISITFAASTFGLILGGLIGGPIGYCLAENTQKSSMTISRKTNKNKNYIINAKNIQVAVFYLLLTIAIGSILSNFLEDIGFIFPSSVGTMIASASLTNILGKIHFIELPHKEIQVLSEISLMLFLSLATMEIKPWQLLNIALPLLFILITQAFFMAIFAIFIVYPIMGKNYEAAAIASGHCGFGLGVVATSMANINSLEKKYGNCKNAIFIVSLVGSLFINFFNSIIITILLNFII